ncbi:MAG: acetyl-CoA decarbonylase/synthase complex subunit gamma [Methanomicrobia archaeon]|nr:acetyl-CoA decarbonylase/synthase complex subunit gamma [Methanomicrobia archaeon]
MKLSSPMEIWKYLPGTNCGDCGEKTCLAFASLLKERKRTLEECIPLREARYSEKAKQLADLLAPEIREVEIGVGARALKLGGEDVLHRHELTFFNRTALAYDVWDTLDANELRARVERITNWRKFYVGDFLTVDAIAVRSVSGDPGTFAACVNAVAEYTDLPLVLCSFDTEVLEAGLQEVTDRKSLVYAANNANWKEVLELAQRYSVPVTLFSPDLDKLTSLAMTFSSAGVEDIVLDPGTYPTGEGLAGTFSRLVRLRRAGIVEANKSVAYPLMAVPMTAWLIYGEVESEEDALDASYWEAMLAAMGSIKYADILILHSIEPHSLIAERTLVANIYTDPRRPVSVEPGLRKIGTPTADSPLFLTTNFALTYYTVESDLSSNKIDSYLMVVDTDGIGVEASVAGGQLTAGLIKDALESNEAEKKLHHKTLVIPGLAARLSGETEDVTGWNVLVGPRDSGRIPGWMEGNWPPKTVSA